MYNRYLEQPAVQADSGLKNAAPPSAERKEESGPRRNSALGEITNGLGNTLGGLLKSVSLGDLDTGDILLILIILLLFLEGDDLEIAITLGVMLLLGLGDD